MARPRKYKTEAEAKAAKVEQRRQQRAAEHARKIDPTKRKDAAVNYPAAPINAETLEIIEAICAIAGDLSFSGRPMKSDNLHAAAKIMAQWERENRQTLPVLPDDAPVYAAVKGRPVKERVDLPYKWGKLRTHVRYDAAIALPRASRNSTANKSRDAKDQAAADTAGLSLADYRARRQAAAISAWNDKAATAALKVKGEATLAKRKARIDRQDARRMKEHETFGRF
ncbi:hypothetical protein [Ciceribacter thiooxidans]|uniref:Uncharacterized protein n=1 Tax=Ciceribacter thiooxidans TaxID=1969821 RepID=A0ABV7I6J1_9HYPH|nr:hypothetical protein [Ciceribacter thiooxidans]